MQVQVLLCAPTNRGVFTVWLAFRKDSGKFSFTKISKGFPKVLEEGGVTAKIYQSRVRDKYDLFTLAFYMDGWQS